MCTAQLCAVAGASLWRVCLYADPVRGCGLLLALHFPRSFTTMMVRPAPLRTIIIPPWLFMRGRLGGVFPAIAHDREHDEDRGKTERRQSEARGKTNYAGR